MVVETVADFTYLPLAAAGLARSTAWIRASALACELLGAERHLADGGLHDAGLLGAELDLTGLELADRLGDVRRHRAGLGVGHQAARAEHAAQAPDHPHHVGGGDDGVELQPAALDLLGQLLAADEVRARLFGLAHLVAGREHQDAQRLAGAVRQHHGAAHHLVGVLGIDAQAHGHVERSRRTWRRRCPWPASPPRPADTAAAAPRRSLCGTSYRVLPRRLLLSAAPLRRRCRGPSSARCPR